MKEYFSHDYNARTDRKLTNLSMIHGLTGIGAFWCIIEMLYENEGILPTEYDRIAFELRTDNNLIKSVINDFELFVINGDTFYSESVNSRLKIRTDKSDKARENVAKRWDKYKGNTPVLQSNEVGNTIKVKESKVKDIKLKESKEDKSTYSAKFLIFWQAYPRKEKKMDAFKAWQKIDKNLLETILQSIQVHKLSKQWKENEGQFIPHPATFLNGRQWEDEPVVISNKPQFTY
jgi:hypothetical protein